MVAFLLTSDINFEYEIIWNFKMWNNKLESFISFWAVVVLFCSALVENLSNICFYWWLYSNKS